MSSQSQSRHSIDAISYPMEGVIPSTGELVSITEGVFWLRMPLPMSLDHINLYMLDDGDGWFIVDTGMNLPDTQAIWETIFSQYCSYKPVKGVIVTHLHPDHIGLAGWLCQYWNAPLYMSANEYFSARALVAMLQASELSVDHMATFYRYAGQPQIFIDSLKKRMQGFAKMVSPLPNSYRRLKPNGVLSIGGRKWRIITGGGHSIEHACLYCESDKLLIAGDQILPRISPNVSVVAVEPEGNPLQDWLNTQQALLTLDESTLVLPAHNEPFIGLKVRAKALLDHHEQQMDLLLDACDTAKTATQLLDVLFQREIAPSEISMAVGECIAHLHLLVERGKLSRQDNNGIYYYQRR